MQQLKMVAHGTHDLLGMHIGPNAHPNASQDTPQQPVHIDPNYRYTLGDNVCHYIDGFLYTR